MQSELLITPPASSLISSKSLSLPNGDSILDPEVLLGLSQQVVNSVPRRSLPTDRIDYGFSGPASNGLIRSKDDAYLFPVNNSCRRSISTSGGIVLPSCSFLLNNTNIPALNNRSEIKKLYMSTSRDSSKNRGPMKAMPSDSSSRNNNNNNNDDKVGNTSNTSDLTSLSSSNMTGDGSRLISEAGERVETTDLSCNSLPVLPNNQSASSVPEVCPAEGSKAACKVVSGQESQKSKRSVTPPVPQGTTPLSHQVAGHVFGRENGQRKNKHGFLQSSDKAILKPLQSGGKGERELLFYQRVFSEACTTRDLITLRPLIPKYLDVWTTPEHPGMKYLKLVDLTNPYSNPSILDVKIGPVTYDDEADEDKIRREKSKFPWLEQVGYQLVGMKVYQGDAAGYETIDRKFLRALNEKTIVTEGLAAFFRPVPEPLRSRLLDAFIRRIDTIESWFNEQRTLKIIASSLLFIYDGHTLSGNNLLPSTLNFNKSSVQNPPTNLLSSLSEPANERLQNISCSTNQGLDNNRASEPICEVGCDSAEAVSSKVVEELDDKGLDSLVELRMIDFTHVFNCKERDENYLIGLRSLRQHLRMLKSCSV